MALVAIGGMGLEERQGTATVLDKSHRGAGKTYSTQIIGNRTVAVPQTTGEMYVLSVDLDGVRSEAAVDKTLYVVVGPRDPGRVAYQQRLTDSVQVVAITF
jgi:hypothetical protein